MESGACWIAEGSTVSFPDEADCWERETLEPGQCLFSGSDEGDRLSHRKRVSEHCVVCQRFQAAASSRGSAVVHLADEVLSLRARLRDVAQEVEAFRRQLGLFDQTLPVFQTSDNRDEILAVALTAITAGKGFGLNRAILLLLDPDREELTGQLALGPRRREEAARVWRELEQHDYTLDEMARLFFRHRMAEERAKFQDLLAELSTPLSRREHLFVRSFYGPQAVYVHDLEREPAIDRSQVEALGVAELVLVPLASERGKLGLLLADNLVNGRRLSPGELTTLSSFVRHVAEALERVASHGRLEEEVRTLTQSHELLKEQQELAIRREKFAVAEKITASVAHSIRNPLMVIGGFARRLSGATSSDDPRRSYVDFIVSETKRLEGVLRDVLAHAEAAESSLYPGSLNDLVRRAHAELMKQCDGVQIRLKLEEGLPPVQMDGRKTSYCLEVLARRALQKMRGRPGARLEIATAAEDGGLELSLTAEGIAAGELDPEDEDGFAFPDEIGGSHKLFLCAKIMEGQGAGLRVDRLGTDRLRFRLCFRTVASPVPAATPPLA